MGSVEQKLEFGGLKDSLGQLACMSGRVVHEHQSGLLHFAPSLAHLLLKFTEEADDVF